MSCSGSGTGSGTGTEGPSSIRVFVGGIPYGCSEERFAEELSGVDGYVSSQIAFDRNTGSSKGFGFVSVSTEEQASTLINLETPMSIDGRNLKFSEYKPKQYQIYVGGFEEEPTEESLTSEFSKFGTVQSVNIRVNERNGNISCCVSYGTLDEYRTALAESTRKVAPFRRRQQVQNTRRPRPNSYESGYEAGQQAGYIKGKNDGYRNAMRASPMSSRLKKVGASAGVDSSA